MIPDDSKLNIIGEYSFISLRITKISIPSSVIEIRNNAFEFIYSLKQIEFSSDSNLQIIGSSLITETTIESFIIPSKVVEIQDGWCQSTPFLTEIKMIGKNENFIYYKDQFLLGKSTQESEIFDVLLFARRDIEHAIIPSFITRISSYSFENCCNLTKLEIEENSQLEIICDYAFSNTSIEKISIPPSLTTIQVGAFFECQDLLKVDIPSDSKLQIINDYSFYSTSIFYIFIPPHVTFIGGASFSNCRWLKQIEIPPNSELRIIGNGAFSYSGIERINVPSCLTEIHCNAFHKSLLSIIEMPGNSQLRLIGKSAFSESVIGSFWFPSNLTIIEGNVFGGCSYLQIIEYSESFDLSDIRGSIFDPFQIVMIMVPVELKNNFVKYFYQMDTLDFLFESDFY